VNAIPLAASSVPCNSRRPAAPVHLNLPEGGFARTQEELRSLSDGVRESLVLWAGRPTGAGDAEVTHVLSLECPANDHGLVVPLDERLEALEFVRREELLIFADLHTHPAAAFLSEVDRARPFGSKDGFYAIVVPDFAIGDAPEGWAMYEARAGNWFPVDVPERITG
jgi:hypothetical protein